MPLHSKKLMTPPLFIVGLGGTLRDGSSSEQALKIALAHASRLGCDTRLFAGPDLLLSHYDPGRQERSPAELALVEALRRADGLILATPGYHGGISGLVKNAIDFIEDMRADEQGVQRRQVVLGNGRKQVMLDVVVHVVREQE